MAQERHTRRSSLDLLWQEVVGSCYSSARHVEIHADVRLASALEARRFLEIERTEALERSDRMDRFWQVLRRKHGLH